MRRHECSGRSPSSRSVDPMIRSRGALRHLRRAPDRASTTSQHQLRSRPRALSQRGNWLWHSGPFVGASASGASSLTMRIHSPLRSIQERCRAVLWSPPPARIHPVQCTTRRPRECRLALHREQSPQGSCCERNHPKSLASFRDITRQRAPCRGDAVSAIAHSAEPTPCQ